MECPTCGSNTLHGKDEYYWVHIPSGKTGKVPFDSTYYLTTTRLQRLERVNKWSKQNPTVWQYWMD